MPRFIGHPARPLLSERSKRIIAALWTGENIKNAYKAVFVRHPLRTVVASAQAQSRTEMKWAGLPAVVGKKVRIVMPDGRAMVGMATSVEPEALMLQVRKAGKVEVPRASLKILEVDDSHIRGRVIGVSVGTVLGVGFAALASIAASDQGFLLGPAEPAPSRAAAFAGAAVAFPVGGYFLGKKADAHWKTIAIIE